MDLLRGVQDMLGNPDQDGNGDGPRDFQMPDLDQLLKALDMMPNMTENEKDDMRETLLEGLASTNFKKGEPPINFFMPHDVYKQLLMMMGFIILVLLILGFMGCKLYKGMRDRERKKEEKRLLKEAKKET